MDRAFVEVGSKFGNWLVMRKSDRKRYWLCHCTCGVNKKVCDTNLTMGKSKGCRACNIKRMIENPHKLTHGHRRERTPTYISWRSMRARCLYEGATQYEYYGGRGITICERWDKFQNFLADMGERPEGTTLDREDTNGNYEKSNCSWSSRSKQMRNTRRASHYRI